MPRGARPIVPVASRAVPRGRLESAMRGGSVRKVEGRLNIQEKDAVTLRTRLMGHTDAVTSVRFDVSVGAGVPDYRDRARSTDRDRDRVPGHFLNYEYVVSEQEIVIVDPKTREVVEVIGGGRHASATTTTKRERRTITTEQRQVIHRTVVADPGDRVEFDEQTSRQVPATVTLRRLPEAVLHDVPDVAEDEYFVDRQRPRDPGRPRYP